MHGLVIATAWITFLAVLTGIILQAVGHMMEMKSGASDADKAKGQRLKMIGFWILVVGGIFGLIAAISASCQPQVLTMLSGLRRAYNQMLGGSRGGRGELAMSAAALG